jgi:phosphate transport system protein
MRTSYQKQLETLHIELIRMGALCEDAIACAVAGLLDDDRTLRQKAVLLEKEIDLKEREIESICVRLLLREQPVAGDLRQITAAQRMVHDMERIGDQAADIAELAETMRRSGISGGYSLEEAIASGVHIGDMAAAVTDMLTASVDSFVQEDGGKAGEVIAMDDRVDALFLNIKQALIDMITQNNQSAGAGLDMLMIAKYLERSGDHAVNIAEWVVYSMTGERGKPA